MSAEGKNQGMKHVTTWARWLWMAGLWAGAVVAHAQVGGFYITPTRLDFDARARTGVLTLANDGKAPLNFQVRLVRWTQDADGKDVTEDSGDLIFFPRVTTVEAESKRILRVGLRGTTLEEKEKTYRLIVEELPPATDKAVPKLEIQMRFQFSIPLFVAPANPLPAAELEDVSVSKGALRFRVRNIGNETLLLSRMLAMAGEKVLQEGSGWYLMPGVSREYALQIPEDACRTLGAADLEVITDKLVLKHKVEVAPAACN